MGAGAAGLATAIFTRELSPRQSVLLLDGARRPGAKILVSGGGRCNVTNRSVSERDFWGGRSTIVRRILRGFTVAETRAFFERLGVPLHEEANGKLFPDSNRARDVLDALLHEAARVGVALLTERRVERVRRLNDRFVLETSRGPIEARRIVLATGGLSLPKSGSDGHGYQLARSLGHSIAPTTPALAPLLLAPAAPERKIGSARPLHSTAAPLLLERHAHDRGYRRAERPMSGPGRRVDRDRLQPGVSGPAGGGHPMSSTNAPDNTPAHAALSGVTHPAEITVWVDGRVAARLTGSLLWTHFGLSGPAALDASRHWAQADRAGHDVRLTLSLLPGVTFDGVEEHLLTLARAHPRSSLANLLAARLPASVVAVVMAAASIDTEREAGQMTRVERRRLAHQLSAYELAVTGTRGYNYAEVTAGGVPLDEVDAQTLESRLCPGLSFAGEILDVDGRLGGFNFQWAWSSARAVARGLAQDRVGQAVDEGGG